MVLHLLTLVTTKPSISDYSKNESSSSAQPLRIPTQPDLCTDSAVGRRRSRFGHLPYINSPGGSVTAGMAIYDTMQYVTNDVATVAMGLAASMGQFLLSAGEPGKRYALPHARIMMHQPSGGLGGTASDIKIQAEQMLLIKKQLAELIAEQTGQTLEQVEQDSDRDRWFTADQAKEYGFIDHVVRSAGDVAGKGGTA